MPRLHMETAGGEDPVGAAHVIFAHVTYRHVAGRPP